MSKSVFISGSISIKTLPSQVKESILNIIEQNMTILVGDAPGIDTLVQDLCQARNYSNLTVYTITSFPRYLADTSSNFKHIFVDTSIKKERERQTHKDKAMSDDSTFSLVVWDGFSKGSFANINRALDQNKKAKVFYTVINDFLSPNKTTPTDMEYIYRENNGYSTAEIVEYLKDSGVTAYKRSQDLNKFLLSENLLTKEGSIYIPTSKNPDLFIVETYRGRVKGVKFNSKFIDWIEAVSQTAPPQATSLFT